MTNELIVNNQSNHQVVQTADGKFKRVATYEAFSSVRPETREQKIAMMNLLESDDVAIPLNESVGAEIKIADVITKPYDTVDEETGEIKSGVLTYLITPEGVAYVTSSKSVYFTLKTIFNVFGLPHYSPGEEVIVKVVKKQGQNFKYIDIKVVG